MDPFCQILRDIQIIFSTLSLVGLSPTQNETMKQHYDTKYINKILDPVREHFEKPEMKALAERVASYRVTR